jgi:SAM-dependent methyltransferase
MNDQLTHDQVKDYYGKVLQTSADLKTDACCTAEGLPDFLKPILSQIQDEVLAKYYGCGLVLPEQLAGTRILDLGCGAGRDVYALSALVGEHGQVVGVDMTQEQLDVALSHQEFHAQQFGYKAPNTRFEKGFIEQLDQLDLEENSFDIIVSNCVINLSPDKLAVLRQCFDLLKPGGEMYFSDVYAARRVPQSLKDDPVLWGECISGALYWNDFIHLAKRAGFTDPRLVTSRPLMIGDQRVSEKLQGRRFYSATYRLFKLHDLEPDCEDYGQAVTYKGTIEHHPTEFSLDAHHVMPTGKVFPVCGNTWRMLHDTRFKAHFDFHGNFDQHFGIFEGCGVSLPFTEEDSSSTGGVGGESSCC